MKIANLFPFICTLLLLPTTILPVPTKSVVIEKAKKAAKKHGVWLAGIAAGAAVFFAPEINQESSLYKKFGAFLNQHSHKGLAAAGEAANQEMLGLHPFAWPLTKWLVEREPLTGFGFTRARFLGTLIMVSAIGLGAYTIALFARQNKIASKNQIEK